MPFIDDQRTNKDDTDDLAPKLTLITSVLMMTLTTCFIVDKKLIDRYQRSKALSIWQILIIIIATSRLNIVPLGSFREF